MILNLPENIWNSRSLRSRFLAEANFDCAWGFSDLKHYWILAPQADSPYENAVVKNFEPSIMYLEPHPIQQEFAKELKSALQTDCGNDGIWVVGFTHPPSMGDAVAIEGDTVWSRMIMIWLDKDADPHYTLESDLPVDEIIKNGIQTYLDHANEAQKQWREQYSLDRMTSDMGLKEDQLVKESLSTLN